MTQVMGVPPRPERVATHATPSDRLAIVVSALIGALALSVSSYNVYLQRQQVRAQVWPRLEWSYQNADGFTFNLHNTGVGPAEIKTVRVLVDDVPVATWDEAFQRLTGSEIPHFDMFISGHVLGPGVLVHPTQVRDARGAALVDAQQRRVHVQICYCSTLGECWRLEDYRAPRVASTCSEVPAPFEQ